MKSIVSNKITSISVDSENSGFPIENILDEHPANVWRSDGDYQATITCEVQAGSSAIALFNTNAKSVNISIEDPNMVAWGSDSEWGENNEWAYFAPAVSTDIALQDNSNFSYALWGDYEYISTNMIATILLVTDIGTTLEAGVLIIGEAKEFVNPVYGLTEAIVDYSIVKELHNGSVYVKDRAKVRQFSFDLNLKRKCAIENDFYTFMYELSRIHGSRPAAWALTDIGFNWIVYGRFTSMPSGSHYSAFRSNISATITEVV